jgi:ribosome biogenesis GTPase A
MKSLRNDIDTLRCNAEKILGELDQKVNNPSESTWGMGKDFSKTADELRLLLKRENIPESYKVAVVGKIKAGKSTFINQLLESNLAGVNTNPETAAETTFRHGDSTKCSGQLNSDTILGCFQQALAATRY